MPGASASTAVLTLCATHNRNFQECVYFSRLDLTSSDNTRVPHGGVPPKKFRNQERNRIFVVHVDNQFLQLLHRNLQSVLHEKDERIKVPVLGQNVVINAPSISHSLVGGICSLNSCWPSNPGHEDALPDRDARETVAIGENPAQDIVSRVRLHQLSSCLAGRNWVCLNLHVDQVRCLRFQNSSRANGVAQNNLTFSSDTLERHLLVQTSFLYFTSNHICWSRQLPWGPRTPECLSPEVPMVARRSAGVWRTTLS